MLRKLALFTVLFTISLLSIGSILARADVLPPSCEDRNSNSRQCKADREQDRYCRLVRGNPAGASEQDLEKQRARSQEKRCGGPGIPGETSTVSGSCSDWIEYCDSPADVARAPWFYLGFLVTVLVEGLVLFIALRPFPKRRLPLIVAINAATYVPLVLGLTWVLGQGASTAEYRVTALIAEGVIVLVEMLAITWLFRTSVRKAFAVSLIANVLSVAIGMLIHGILAR